MISWIHFFLHSVSRSYSVSMMNIPDLSLFSSLKETCFSHLLHYGHEMFLGIFIFIYYCFNDFNRLFVGCFSFVRVTEREHLLDLVVPGIMAIEAFPPTVINDISRQKPNTAANLPHHPYSTNNSNPKALFFFFWPVF